MLSSDDSGTIENMRVTLREANSMKRKEDRLYLWNTHRTILGECPGGELFSIEYVCEKAKLLKKKKIRLEDYRYLPNALIQCEENINSFLKIDQSLSGLIRDLSGNNPILQLYATNCCCNIALGNAKACTALGKQVIPYLLNELEGLNYALLDVCIWTIGNLISGSNKALSILHAQDCLKYLILLSYNCDNIILPSVIYALLHYVYGGFYQIPEDTLAELTQVTVKRNLLYKNSDFIWLLALLSSSNICTTYLYPVLPELVDYLYRSDETTNISEITASIRILANTLHNCCEDKIDILLNNPKYSQQDLCTLLNKLLLHQHIHIRKETLWLIGNLYNHKSLIASQTIRDIIPFLSSLNQAILSIGNCM